MSRRSRLPRPPFLPMEAKSVSALPEGELWQYEPKWDGFRCLAFRTTEGVYLQSKSGQPLARYFPDLVAALEKIRANDFVMDGEIVIPVSGRLSFNDLLLRVHPAASRVRTLAQLHPAMYVIFDLLRRDGIPLFTRALWERREALESFYQSALKRSPSIRLSPATQHLKVAQRWYGAKGANLDGVMAKRLDLPYRSGDRDGMQKVKHRRTADCVVGGFRYDKAGTQVGSLLLGLYDSQGLLHHVGFTSSFSRTDRAKLLPLLKPLIAQSPFTGQSPGGASRWSTRRTSEWAPLRPTLVVEIEYDHFTGNRFRHGTTLVRWRGDKRPEDCTFDQIDTSTRNVAMLLRVRTPSKRSRRARASN